MSSPHQAGVLLVNLGTPDAHHTAAVRRYLREFLYDPKVIDIHPVGRFFLLEGAILPFRPAKSAAAYKKIWMPEGSPLRVYSDALVHEIQKALGRDVPVELGMQYGSPSIAYGLGRLQARGVARVVVAPLYPQYATSSTASSMSKAFAAASEMWSMPALSSLPPFYDRPEFLDAFAAVARPMIAEARADHVLFSFHGLPERHMRKADVSGNHCLANANCCDTVTSVNRYCYRAQCYATARGLASRLELAPERHSVSFQSRLGRTPWITPHTDVVIPELAKKGVKRVAVMCPAFVADCLETLEEIGIRAREDFKRAGGEELTLVPSLNASEAWVRGLAKMLREQLPIA